MECDERRKEKKIIIIKNEFDLEQMNVRVCLTLSCMRV